MPKSYGVVFLVGAGPGAPDLFTLRGQDRLGRAEVVVYDDLCPPDLVAMAPGEAERIYVGKREDRKTLQQNEICDLLVRRAKKGQTVVRLKGGDPFVFGRGGEEAEALALAGVPFEVVPGITSVVAAPAFAGIPLTHREHADGFEVISGHRPDTPPRLTAVVLMGMRRLADNVALLRRRGYAGDLPAAVVRRGTTASQQTVVATLDTIAEAAAGMGSPAVLVVGTVVGVRERIAWAESMPLFGQRVLVTRARHQAAGTCRLLESLGAETVSMPTIAIRPPADPEPLHRAAGSLGDYDYLVLTSANGVEALFQAMDNRGVDSRALAGVCICAMGPGTSKALAAHGVLADLEPEEHRAEGILELLDEARIRDKRILLPRAAVAREILPDTLRQRGALLDLVEAYRTGIPGEDETARGVAALERGQVEIITFTSASTAQNYAAILGDRLDALSAGKLVVAIGPITRDACLALGIKVDLMPPKYTLPAMVDSLVEYLKQ